VKGAYAEHRASMYAHIVIAVDGSREAKRAARAGLELGRRFDATVDVLHVVERRSLRLTRDAEEKRRLRERGEAVLAEIEEIASASGQSIGTELGEGNPAARIGEFAAEQDADLLVVGRQGTTGLGRRLLGGVTEQLLHRSDVPVFVVPDETGDPAAESRYRRILLPTDGSENADAAVPHAAAVARQYDAVVHVLNVVELQAAGGLFSAGGLDEAFVERLETRGRETVERVEGELRGGDPDLGVETAVERSTSFDGAADGVREYVSEAGIDLVVMGSHGRSNVGRQLLGSVASAVLRTVDVPVLVAKRAS
jgi:nucleotide-binding universal stress UspA family protein